MSEAMSCLRIGKEGDCDVSTGGKKGIKSLAARQWNVAVGFHVRQMLCKTSVRSLTCVADWNGIVYFLTKCRRQRKSHFKLKRKKASCQIH